MSNRAGTRKVRMFAAVPPERLAHVAKLIVKHDEQAVIDAFHDWGPILRRRLAHRPRHSRD